MGAVQARVIHSISTEADAVLYLGGFPVTGEERAHDGVSRCNSDLRRPPHKPVGAVDPDRHSNGYERAAGGGR